MKERAYKIALDFISLTEVDTPKEKESVDPKKLETQAKETLQASYPLLLTSLHRSLAIPDLFTASNIMLTKLNMLAGSEIPDQLFSREMASQKNKILLSLKDITLNENVLMKNIREYIRNNPELTEEQLDFYVKGLLRDIRKSTILYLNRINNIIR